MPADGERGAEGEEEAFRLLHVPLLRHGSALLRRRRGRGLGTTPPLPTS